MGSALVADHDRTVSEAQARYLDRCAPGHRTSRLAWSGGSTQLIELGEGPPLLLVHGGLGEAFQWGSIMAPLAKRHRVLAIDRPGHGLADPFDYRGVDMLAFARTFLGGVLDALNIRSIPIVANSMGALWSIAFALERPERVQRVVVAGSPAGIRRELPLGLRLGTIPVFKRVIHALMKRPNRDAVRNFMKQLLVVHPERLENDYLDLAVASQARNAPSWITLIERALDFRGLKPELMLDDHWKDLSVPTTFVWGEKDAFCPPEDGERVAAANPRVRVVRVPDAGHTPWFDQPDRVVQAIEQALEQH